MTRFFLTFGTLVLGCLATVAPNALALEPPTPDQLAKYRSDGTLSRRAADACAIGNHLVAPYLARRFAIGPAVAERKSSAVSKGLPSTGHREVFALLIGFQDYPGDNSASEIDWRLFGDGPDGEYPYESLRDFYQRSSFGLLEIEGRTLGWYNAPYSRSSVAETTAGREGLISEAIEYFDSQGHDFSRYDSDGDGRIDYFLVYWSGPHQDWADFWWGYQTSFDDSSFMVEHRRQQGNDSDTPGSGLLIWHIDAQLSDRGVFLNDNSFSDHKLLRLMEADGLEGIELNLGADAGDYYRPGDRLDGETAPSSSRYDGAPTGLEQTGPSRANSGWQGRGPRPLA